MCDRSFDLLVVSLFQPTDEQAPLRCSWQKMIRNDRMDEK